MQYMYIIYGSSTPSQAWSGISVSGAHLRGSLFGFPGFELALRFLRNYTLLYTNHFSLSHYCLILLLFFKTNIALPVKMLSSRTKATNINYAFGELLPPTLKTMLDIGKGTFYIWSQELLDFIENVFGGPSKAIINHVEIDLDETNRNDLDPKSKAEILLFPPLPQHLREQAQRSLRSRPQEVRRRHQEVREKPRKEFSLWPKATYLDKEHSHRAVQESHQKWPSLTRVPSARPPTIRACKFSWLSYVKIETTHKTGNFSTKLSRAQQYFTLTQDDKALEARAANPNPTLHDFSSKNPISPATSDYPTSPQRSTLPESTPLCSIPISTTSWTTIFLYFVLT